MFQLRAQADSRAAELRIIAGSRCVPQPHTLEVQTRSSAGTADTTARTHQHNLDASAMSTAYTAAVVAMLRHMAGIKIEAEERS